MLIYKFWKCLIGSVIVYTNVEWTIVSENTMSDHQNPAGSSYQVWRLNFIYISDIIGWSRASGSLAYITTAEEPTLMHFRPEVSAIRHLTLRIVQGKRYRPSADEWTKWHRGALYSNRSIANSAGLRSLVAANSAWFAVNVANAKRDNGK